MLTLSTYSTSFSFCSWCSWTKWGGWVNVSFYIFVFGVNQMEWEKEVSLGFSFVTPGFWEVLLPPIMNWYCRVFAVLWVFVVLCNVFKPVVVGFCSIRGLCYSDWWVWDLKKLAQFQGIEMSPGFFQDFLGGYIKP